MPGLRPAVEDHEFWGGWARNIFLVVFVAELVALALRKFAEGPLCADDLDGHRCVLGLGALYEAGEHGGAIVYGYAGGVGTRSGDPQDVSHCCARGCISRRSPIGRPGAPTVPRRCLTSRRSDSPTMSKCCWHGPSHC
jgi:hypothetical protein